MTLPDPIPVLLRDDHAAIDPRMREYLDVLTEHAKLGNRTFPLGA
jgi:hypothetical protein